MVFQKPVFHKNRGFLHKKSGKALHRDMPLANIYVNNQKGLFVRYKACISVAMHFISETIVIII